MLPTAYVLKPLFIISDCRRGISKEFPAHYTIPIYLRVSFLQSNDSPAQLEKAVSILAITNCLLRSVAVRKTRMGLMDNEARSAELVHSNP